MHLASDRITEYCALIVTGPDPETVHRLGTGLGEALNPLSREEILAPLDPQLDRLTRVMAVAVVGLGRPGSAAGYPRFHGSTRPVALIWMPTPGAR